MLVVYIWLLILPIIFWDVNELKSEFQRVGIFQNKGFDPSEKLNFYTVTS